MSCEHEFASDADDIECELCGSSRVEILTEQLAAANARVAELEYKLMAQTETALQENAKREQAEAQCAKYHVALLKIKTWCGEPMHYDGVELQYVLNIAKASLEEKP